MAEQELGKSAGESKGTRKAWDRQISSRGRQIALRCTLLAK